MYHNVRLRQTRGARAAFGPGPLGLSPSPGRDGLAKEKILQHKRPLPPHKRATADATGYLSIVRLRPCFDLDHLIERAAVQACEWIECSWPAPRHVS
jgi:hypothetical protein